MNGRAVIAIAAAIVATALPAGEAATTAMSPTAATTTEPTNATPAITSTTWSVSPSEAPPRGLDARVLPRAAPPAVAIEQRPGAALPLGVPLVDSNGRALRLGALFGDGRAVVVVFAWYRCSNLCETVSQGALEALAESGAGAAAVRVVAIGIDPTETAADAQASVDRDRRFARLAFARAAPSARPGRANAGIDGARAAAEPRAPPVDRRVAADDPRLVADDLRPTIDVPRLVADDLRPTIDAPRRLADDLRPTLDVPRLVADDLRLVTDVPRLVADDLRLATDAPIPAIDAFVGDAAAVGRIADAAGFRFRRDADGALVHAAGFLVATPDGRVSRWFLGVRHDAAALRDAVQTARGGAIGAIVDRLVLLCRHVDRLAGRWSDAVLWSLRALGVALVALLAAWIWRHRGVASAALP